MEFSQAVGDQLPKTLVERLTALRTRIVVMANQEGPTITRTRRKTQHGIYIYIWEDLLYVLYLCSAFYCLRL